MSNKRRVGDPTNDELSKLVEEAPRCARIQAATGACAIVLGGDVYTALVNARIPLTRILRMAGEQCFIENRQGFTPETIRAALKRLETTGAL